MSLTLEVSQKPIFILNVFFWENSAYIVVTNVVHSLSLPLVNNSVAKVVLSTTVYKMPFIVRVSPTLALGHLHVPF